LTPVIESLNELKGEIKGGTKNIGESWVTMRGKKRGKRRDKEYR
jgi:hypothetical protein